jgi:hypothetical protein
MPWECGECNAREDVNAACHHCGKPLCKADQVWIADFVFSDEPGEIGRQAAHCRPCLRQYHLLIDVHLSRDTR